MRFILTTIFSLNSYKNWPPGQQNTSLQALREPLGWPDHVLQKYQQTHEIHHDL
jgi:hypothetical protein